MSRTVRLSSQDAIARVHLAKIGYQESSNHEVQTILNNAALANTSSVQTLDMGNPNIVRLFITASQAATFAVWHSFDGVKWFHDTTQDIVFAGAADKITDVKGAPIIKIVPSVSQTAATIITLAIY